MKGVLLFHVCLSWVWDVDVRTMTAASAHGAFVCGGPFVLCRYRVV